MATETDVNVQQKAAAGGLQYVNHPLKTGLYGLEENAVCNVAMCNLYTIHSSDFYSADSLYQHNVIVTHTHTKTVIKKKMLTTLTGFWRKR